MGGWKRIGSFPPTFNFAASARNIWQASIGFYGNGLIDVEEIPKILKRFWQRRSREIRNSCNTILLSLISFTSLRRIRRFLGVVFPPSPEDGCYFSGKQMKGIVPAEFIEVAWFENISLYAPKFNIMYDYRFNDFHKFENHLLLSYDKGLELSWLSHPLYRCWKKVRKNVTKIVAAMDFQYVIRKR